MTDLPDGLFRVTERDLGIRGPNDPYAPGMRCMDCKVWFAVGDLYAHRPVDEGVVEVVCLGCAALTVPLEQA